MDLTRGDAPRVDSLRGQDPLESHASATGTFLQSSYNSEFLTAKKKRQVLVSWRRIKESSERL